MSALIVQSGREREWHTKVARRWLKVSLARLYASSSGRRPLQMSRVYLRDIAYKKYGGIRHLQISEQDNA